MVGFHYSSFNSNSVFNLKTKNLWNHRAQREREQIVKAGISCGLVIIWSYQNGHGRLKAWIGDQKKNTHQFRMWTVFSHQLSSGNLSKRLNFAFRRFLSHFSPSLVGRHLGLCVTAIQIRLLFACMSDVSWEFEKSQVSGIRMCMCAVCVCVYVRVIFILNCPFISCWTLENS